jgi:hypothetical protein
VRFWVVSQLENQGLRGLRCLGCPL